MVSSCYSSGIRLPRRPLICRRPAVMLFVADALVAGQVSGVAAQQSSRPSGQRASDVGIGVRAGSLGAGITVSKLLVSHLGLRVGDFFSQTFNGKKQTDITYDIKGQWNGLSALLDLYPAPRGSFHLTGGLITKPVKLTLTGVPTATGAIPINSRDYFASQVGTLTGTIDFASVEPYRAGLRYGRIEPRRPFLHLRHWRGHRQAKSQESDR